MLTAGIGAYLSLSRGKSKRELSWFLVTRGLWLVVLEVTWVRSFGWMFNFDYHLVFFLVIWTLGWSMVILAGLDLAAVAGVDDRVSGRDCGAQPTRRQSR